MTTIRAAAPAHSPIRHVVVENARVQAFVAPIVQHPVGYRGGPILTDPTLQVFRHHRGGAIVDNFAPDAPPGRFLPGDLIYAGALYDHFGHFMAEMIHRILPARALGLGHRFLFVGARGHEPHASFDRLPRHLRDILSFLGLAPDDVVIALDDVVVERLHLVPQASQHHGDPADWYLDLLSAHSGPALDAAFEGVTRPQRLYVSRTRQALEGGLLGEAYLERWLEGAGFQPFYPEEHGFAEQLDHYRKAECVVFTQGSACHGTELLGREAMARVVLIPKSIKAGFFERVLAPRARHFAQAGSPDQVGTMYYDTATRFQHIHLGVSLVDLAAVSRCLDGMGIPCPRFRPWAYRRAAARDLRRYMAGARAARGPDRPQALRLIASFMRRMLGDGLRPQPRA